jgi:hypothetical protein
MMLEPTIRTASPRQARAAPEAMLADVPRCATFRTAERAPAVFETSHPRMRRGQDILAPIGVAVEATAPCAVAVPRLSPNDADHRIFAALAKARHRFVPLQVPSGDLADMRGKDERVGIGAHHGVVRDHRAGIRAIGAAWGMAAG